MFAIQSAKFGPMTPQRCYMMWGQNINVPSVPLWDKVLWLDKALSARGSDSDALPQVRNLISCMFFTRGGGWTLT